MFPHPSPPPAAATRREGAIAAGVIALVFAVVISLLTGTFAASAEELPTFTAAAPATAEVTAEAHQAAADWETVQTAIDTDPSGSVTFDAGAALDTGVGASTIEEFAAGIVAGGGRVVGSTVDSTAVARLETLSASSQSCSGINESSVQWFGNQLKLDSCVANRVSAQLGAGAAAAGIIALIASETGLGGLAGGIVAGVLALGAGVLAACNASGSGVNIAIPWTGLPWCTAQ